MRLAFITGGSKGLGLELCRQLKAAGYEVVDFSRSAPHDYSVLTDLAHPQACASVVASAADKYRDAPLREFVTISNAGTLDPIGPAASKSLEAVLSNLHTNFTSAIVFMIEVMRHFQTHDCRKVIASISSGAALKGYDGWSLYCAAKAGLENFIRSVALEQKRQRSPFLPVNIDPGVIDTPMQAFIRSSSPEDFPDLPRFIQRKAAGGLAAPATVANAVRRIVADPTLVAGERYATNDYLS